MSANKYLSSQLVVSNKYVVRLAESQSDMQAAQFLRYQVFNQELGEGLPESHNNERDADEYDFQCDHLLVVERNTDKVVGTYRMQTYEMAWEHNGFYTNNEFELLDLSTNILKNSVEVGRASIHSKHRNGRVLYLLWKGIAEYMNYARTRYLFGCCSIASVDPKEGWVMMDYLEHHDYTHPHIYLDTKASYTCLETRRDEERWKKIKLPQLFRLYIDLGAKVLSRPALDKTFKTIDFLILVDIEKLDKQSKTLFIG